MTEGLKILSAARDVWVKARDDWHSAQSTYLKSTGWTQRYDFPGNQCLWSRTLPDGSNVCVSKNLAIIIQGNLDTQS